MGFKILVVLAIDVFVGYCVAYEGSEEDGITAPSSMPPTPDGPTQPAGYNPDIFSSSPPPKPAIPLPMSSNSQEPVPSLEEVMTEIGFVPYGPSPPFPPMVPFAGQNESVIMNYLQSVLEGTIEQMAAEMEMQQGLPGSFPASGPIGDLSQIITLMNPGSENDVDETGDETEAAEDLAPYMANIFPEMVTANISMENIPDLMNLQSSGSSEDLQNMEKEMEKIQKQFNQMNQTDDDIMDAIEQLLQQQMQQMHGGFNEMINAYQQQVQEELNALHAEMAEAASGINEDLSEQAKELGVDEDTFRSIVVCGNCTAQLTCPVGHMIVVLVAHYGPINPSMNPDEGALPVLDCQDADNEVIVRALCDYRSKCDVTADSATFGTFCPGTKYLQIEYACLSEDGKA